MIELVVTVVLGSLLLLLLYGLISDEPMFLFPRRNPMIWVIVLVLYPMLSVVPQGIVFRRWFLGRYRSILGTGTCMILVAAIAFAWNSEIIPAPMIPRRIDYPLSATCASPNSSTSATCSL